MIELIKEMILPYPKSVLLFVIGIINLIWFLNLAIQKKNKTPTNKAYFIFSFCVLAWVLGNAYAESGFFTYFGGNGLKYTFSFVGSFTTFSLIAFYYLSSLLRYGKNNLPKYVKFFLVFLVLQNIFFFAIPDIAVVQAEVYHDGSFILLQGKYFFIYYIIMITTIILGVKNMITAFVKSKKENNPIENRRLLFVGLGSSIMYANSIIFHMVYPYLTSDYSFSFIPPLFSVLDIMIVGYGVYKRRFVNIRLFFSYALKALIAFILAIVSSYLLTELINTLFRTIQPIFVYFFATIFTLFTYNLVFKFLNSRSFYRLFGVSNTQHIRQVIINLKEKNKIYTSMSELETDLQNSFTTHSRTVDSHLIPMNSYRRSKYPNLIQYFKKHHSILVTEEIKFVENEKGSVTPFLEELEALGGICLPIFSPNKKLVVLFTLGKKHYDHLYSKEEIEALENMGSYLSMLVNDILYSENLKKQVQRKTKQLTKTIQETKRLVEQQADFMAITAHEFRTPLSIAIFKLDDLVRKLPESESKLSALDVVQSALMNLKDLTQNLFNVQQYDLRKIKVRKVKTSAKIFVEDIYKHFSSLMHQKGLNFSLDSHLKKDSYFNVDCPQLRQVLNNLLTNAYKFTPDGGHITLKAKEKGRYILIGVMDNGLGISEDAKETIFKKFRTAKKGSGIGLGLYICKKIVELHKGKLWVEDNPKGGATFCIQLAKDS